MKLHTRLRKQILSKGPLRLDDYMQAALADPQEGYYIRKDPLGAAGDFTTAPEISQIFGELIGLWCVSLWMAAHRPAFDLVELGPGRGTLMADALRATRNIKGFHDALHVHLVETSPALREKQWQSLAGKHPQVQWHASLADVPSERPCFFIANEFFDALPIRQWQQTPQGWAERRVGLDESNDQQLAFVLDHNSPPPLDMAQIPANAQMIEHCEAAHSITREITQRLASQGGAALLIDYGYLGGTRADTLQAVRDHAFFDPLKEPGTADITAHVDFSTLAAEAKMQAMAVYGPIEQGRFFYRLGATMRMTQLMKHASLEQKKDIVSGVRRLLSPEGMGSLFKVMAMVPNALPVPDGFDEKELLNT